MVDVTECAIWEPGLYEWEYFSPKKQTHTLKYELCLSMKEHKIVWVNGPYKGSVNDLTIARDKLTHALANEKGMGDKAYIGDIHFIAPYKPARDHEQRLFNKHHYTVRQSIERLNKRLKHFECLKRTWRMRGDEGMLLHKWSFYFICYMTQIDFNTSPLTQ